MTVIWVAVESPARGETSRDCCTVRAVSGNRGWSSRMAHSSVTRSTEVYNLVERFVALFGRRNSAYDFFGKPLFSGYLTHDSLCPHTCPAFPLSVSEEDDDSDS